MRQLPGALASAILLSCASSPPTATPPQTAPETPAAPPVASSAGVDPSPPAPSPPPARPSPFLAVAELPAVSRVFPVEGALFVAAQEQTNPGEENAGYPVGVLRGDRLEYPKNFTLSGWFHRIDDIQGKWPDGVDMIAVTDTGRAALAEHFVLTASGWQYKGKPCTFDSCNGNTRYVGMHRVGSDLLALQVAPLPWTAPLFTALRGKVAGYRLAPAPKDCPPPLLPHAQVAVFPQAMGSLRDGTLLSYGRHCSGKGAVELWKPGGGPSTVFVLPSEGSDEHFAPTGRLLQGPGNGAWLLAGQIFTFDGASWKEIQKPSDKPVEVGASGPDGALWVSDGVSIYRRNGDAWEPAPLPEGAAEPNDVAVDAEGTTWVTAGNALLRTRRAGETGQGIPIKTSATPAPKKQGRTFARPGSPRCITNLVLLYGFTKVTPPDYDFPLTRKALKGRKEFEGTRFVVVQDGGKKFFSALMPSFELGQRLVKLIEKEVKGSKPQLLCAEPEVQREVKINLSTGEIIK